MRALLEKSGRYPGLRYGGCVAVADATNLHRVIDTARVCRKQFSVADLIVLSKTDIAPKERTEAALWRLNRDYPDVRIVRGPWEHQPPDILDTLTAWQPARQADRTRDLTLQKRCVAVSPDLRAEELRAFLRVLSEAAYRVKGFVTLREGRFLVDCVGAYCSVTAGDGPCADNRLDVLATEGMPLGKTLREALSWYEGLIWEVP